MLKPLCRCDGMHVVDILFTMHMNRKGWWSRSAIPNLVASAEPPR